jgi:glutathione synthase/RimK-type ligase-like ATP-grasp enzyme
MNPRQVLVLFSRKKRQKATYERLFGALKQAAANQGRNLAFTLSTLDELIIEIRNDILIVTDPASAKELNQFDYIDFNWWGKAKQQALAAATYLARHHVPFLNESIANTEASSKIGEMALMADGDVSLPDTFMSSGEQILRVFNEQQPIQFPLIMKDAAGYGGKCNFLVTDYSHLTQIVRDYPEVDFVIQEFIPNDFDYRCVVINDSITLIIQRARGAEAATHLNNTSAGGTGIAVPLDSIVPEAQAMVLSAARALHREQLCGVDLIIDKHTGKPYILEVNQPPEIEEGAEPQKKMAALLDYIESELAK